MHVVVIGGGVIGLSCAWSLQRRGAQVTVVDRDRCGASTSSGNAGWVTPGLAAPLPAPGVTRQALRWILDRDSPFLIRLRADPAFAAWLLRFWRACGSARFRAGLAATLELARPTPELFDALAADGVEFEMHSEGLLYLALDPAELAGFRAMYEAVAALGFDAEVTELSRAEVHDLEPAAGRDVAAGLLARAERHVRPETLTGGLVRQLRRSGARVVEHRAVDELRRDNGGWMVLTDGEVLAADRIVVAAGVWTRELLRPCAIDLPIEAAKGYSITTRANGQSPRHPLYLTEAKIGVSPFDGAIRVAGTLELAGIDLTLNRRRLDAIARSAARYVATSSDGGTVAWAGLRPVAPDGLPLIGAVPGCDGLFAATAHGMLGVTLAPATGEALAPLVLEDRLEPQLAALRLDRFERHRSREHAPQRRAPQMTAYAQH